MGLYFSSLERLDMFWWWCKSNAYGEKKIKKGRERKRGKEKFVKLNVPFDFFSYNTCVLSFVNLTMETNRGGGNHAL